MFKKYEVGKLFDENKTTYQEGCKIDVTDSGIILMVYYSAPTLEEVNNFKNGDFQFDLTMIDDIIFFIAQFGNEKMDIPYTVHLSKNLTNLDSIKNENNKMLLTVYFIDAKTGILKVLRAIGISSGFYNTLLENIKKQKYTEFNINDYDRNLQTIYRKYSTKDLLKMSIAHFKSQK